MKISIITPSYNQGKYIERTIQSVLTQNDIAFEYFVIDGGSNDNTLQILEKYQAQLSFVSEADEGQTDAVNKGLLCASGDIIGWLNSDDIYYPHAVKKVCDFFATHPEVEVVYGKAALIDENDHKFDLYPTENWDIENLKLRCFLSQPATFFRRRVIEQYGLLDKKLQFCMDYEYWLRLGIQGAKFAYLPEILAGARMYADTKSSRCYLEAHLEAMNMLHERLGKIPSEWLVNCATAKVKTTSNLKFPNPGFFAATSIALWKLAGVHNEGVTRFTAWLKAHLTMMKKLCRKVFAV